MQKKVIDALKEEEVIKRIANLPDKKSIERVLQAIEDAEERERIKNRVEEIRRKKRENNFKPIDDKVLYDIKWSADFLHEKEIADILSVIGVIVGLTIFYVFFGKALGFILSFLVSVVVVALLIASLYKSHKHILYVKGLHDEIYKKYNKEEKDGG